MTTQKAYEFSDISSQIFVAQSIEEYNVAIQRKKLSLADYFLLSLLKLGIIYHLVAF